MITITNLKKEFSAPGHVVKAVSGVSFSVDKGEVIAIIGKSGSGKTTLLNLLGSLEAATSGKIMVDDQDVTAMSDRKLIAYRRTNIGFIFQSYNLIPNLTSLENVMLPMEFAGVKMPARHKRALELLKRVGLDEHKGRRRPGNLSGGEQQRVAIARALANKPRLILADEPTGNLDSKTGKIIIDLLRDVAASEKASAIIVTHDMEITKYVDTTYTLHDGKLKP